jgi:hypothetical protein
MSAKKVKAGKPKPGVKQARATKPKPGAAKVTVTKERSELAELIKRFLKMSPEQREEMTKDAAKKVVAKAIAIEKMSGDFAVNLFITNEQIEKGRAQGFKVSEADVIYEEAADEALARLMRCGNGFGMQRAAVTNSTELSCEATKAMHETHYFLKALDRHIELCMGEAWKIREIIEYFANHVHSLTQHLSDLIEKHPEAVKGIGGDFPHWPFLMFRKDNHLPAPILKQAKAIGLGETCAVDPSPQKSWNALQRYLFEIFWEWQDVKRFIENPPKDEKRSRLELVEVCLFSGSVYDGLSTAQKAEAKLFLDSLDLPPLTKGKDEKDRASRKEWATKFIVPLIDLREPNLESVPAFANALSYRTSTGDRKSALQVIKERVICDLWSMARGS